MTNDNREKLILETLRQTEDLIRSQTEIALAADSRALTFCGILVAAATLMIGLAGGSAMGTGMVWGGITLLFSAALTGLAARPVTWRALGQKGEDFRKDIEDARQFIDVVAEMVMLNDRYIMLNDRVLQKNGRLMWAGYLTAITAPVIGIVVQIYAGWPV